MPSLLLKSLFIPGGVLGFNVARGIWFLLGFSGLAVVLAVVAVLLNKGKWFAFGSMGLAVVLVIVAIRLNNGLAGMMAFIILFISFFVLTASV